MSQNGSKAVLGFKGIQSLRLELWAVEEKGNLNRLSIIQVAVQWYLGGASLFPEMEFCCCEVLLGNIKPKLKSFQRPLA